MPFGQLRERCTKKFMILSVIFLGLLTILLLILENALTAKGFQPTPTPYTEKTSYKQSDQKQAVEIEKALRQSAAQSPLSSEIRSSRNCWLHEDFQVIRRCTRCTEFEINSKSPAACVETGLKEQINCSNSGIAYRSCSLVPELEQKKFLAFESLSLLVAILSYGLVKFRISQLEYAEAKRMEKRLASGV